MKINFYNGFYNSEQGMQCDMNGFMLQNGNEGNLINLPLKFPTDGPVITGDNFVPKGDFSVIPPDRAIQCGPYNITFSKLTFSGPPVEEVVRYISYNFTVSDNTIKTYKYILQTITYT